MKESAFRVVVQQGKIVAENPRFNEQREHVCVKCGADVEPFPDSQASALLVCQSKECGYRCLVLF